VAKEFAWSFSALARYENCPKQYYHISVKKDVKDEGSEYSEEGQIIHKGMYERITKGKPLPLNYRYLESTAAKFVGFPGDVSGELKFAMDRKFAPVSYFDSSVFVRVVVDLLVVARTRAIIVDWKTGKPQPWSVQLDLTAAVLSTHLPEIETFDLAYVWLKDTKVKPSRMRRTKADLVNVWNNLLPRVAKIEQAIKTTDFPAKPSGLCKYCPVVTCPNWKPRE
jgi:PD-(D/E)XK nuclease superfamily